jgi:amidase
MCRTVEDAAISLGVMTGVDSTDSKTLASEGKFHKDYARFLKADGLKGKRIGLLKSCMGFHYKVDSLFMETAEFIKSQGAEVIELDYELPGEINDAEFLVLLYEFKDGLNKYFQSLGPDAKVKSLEELIMFNKSDSIELRNFDQKLLDLAQEKGSLDDQAYRDALIKITKEYRERGIDKIMDEKKLDALILPTGSPAWKTDLVNGDHYLGGNSSIAAIPGYPSISVPMGFIGELPVGISFVGRAWSEPLLIEMAFGFEQGTKARKPPRFIATD